jgi:hypothetical protein
MAAEIAAEFRRKLAGLQRRMAPAEKAAAIRVLKDERDAAMRKLRERRAIEKPGDEIKRQAKADIKGYRPGSPTNRSP